MRREPKQDHFGGPSHFAATLSASSISTAHRIIARLSESIPGDINLRNCSIWLSIWSHLLHMDVPRLGGGSNKLSVTDSRLDVRKGDEA